MKKSLFMLGLAVAAMTSCSNDELMEVNTNNVITFESHVNKGTRNVVETNGNISKFFVIGTHNTVTDFDNVAVTKQSGEWGYAGEGVKWTGSVYNFGAYATSNANTTKIDDVSFADQTLTFTGYTINNANDLVAALKTVDNTGLTNQGTVNLNFKHMLSQVSFQFTNDATENLTLQVSDLTFTAKTKGNCVYTIKDAESITWKNLSTDETFTFDGNNSIAKDGTHQTKSNLVIPGQTVTDIEVTFVAQFKNAGVNFGAAKTYTVNLTGENWKPGFHYRYNASITQDMPTIKFSASVESWKNTDPEYTEI